MFKLNSFTKKAVLGLSALSLLGATQPARAGWEKTNLLCAVIYGVCACVHFAESMDALGDLAYGRKCTCDKRSGKNAFMTLCFAFPVAMAFCFSALDAATR